MDNFEKEILENIKVEVKVERDEENDSLGHGITDHDRWGNSLSFIQTDLVFDKFERLVRRIGENESAIALLDKEIKELKEKYEAIQRKRVLLEMELEQDKKVAKDMRARQVLPRISLYQSLTPSDSALNSTIAKSFEGNFPMQAALPAFAQPGPSGISLISTSSQADTEGDDSFKMRHNRAK